jgi:mono/diheme cytochrome c family protein
MRPVLRALLLLIIGIALLGGAAVWSIAARGLSTRVPPTALEERLASFTRRLAMPSQARSRPNPVAASPEVLDEAIEHFADHCAICHGTDGRGDTEMGRRLYPRAPDMRQPRTQDLTDGELFTIIENGIRLTGMPGWGTGTAEDEEASWKLVHFIRRIPAMTPEEVAKVEALTPRSPAAFRDEEETRRFLSGEDPPAAPDAHRTHGGR